MIIFFIRIFLLQNANANVKQESMLFPLLTKENINNDNNISPIYITSKNFIFEYPNFFNYKGDVNIKKENQVLIADSVKLTQTIELNPVRKAFATGNVIYYDKQIFLKGLSAFYNLNNKNFDINNSEYLFINNKIRGKAKKIKIRDKNRFAIMDNCTFTTCLEKDNNWSILGSKIIIDHKKELVKIWNSQFRIGYLPIFYSPYIKFSISKNRTGFLIPIEKYSSNNGLEFSLPYYINFSKNFNATITPEFITNRGIKINNKFNYLTKTETGNIVFDFLKYDYKYIKDKGYEKCNIRDNNSRWLLHLDNQDNYSKNLFFFVDYTKVSDFQYFVDFSSLYGDTTDGYTKQKFVIGYSNYNLNAKIIKKQFQIFTENTDEYVYKTEPQIDFNFYKNNLNIFNVKTYMQATKFVNVSNKDIYTTRLHLEPELNITVPNKYVTINNTFKLFTTKYNNSSSYIYLNKKFNKNIFRILPMLKSDFKMILERDFFNGSKYIYILEPHIQYIYIPYKNQNKINNFDSTLLSLDYIGIFRDKIYSGLDRIASANKIITGLKTTLYDKYFFEKFNFSIGQIYNLKTYDIENLNNFIKNKNNNNMNSILLVSNLMWRLNKNFGIRGELQYDSNIGNITFGNSAAEYYVNSNQLIQLNYRFINHNYIQNIFLNSTNDNYHNFVKKKYLNNISQLGIILNYPLNKFWNFFGSYYFDTKQKQLSSKLFGLQYNTSCLLINLGYENKIVWKNKNFNSEYYNKILINVELKGFDNKKNLNKQELFNKGIIPYRLLF
ncbi:LPS assembly protein LptD [Candidatus Providencia siddallii]